MISETRTRAGLLRLTARRAAASRAGELLQGKEKALQRERARLSGHARRAASEWAAACRDAGDALVRARMLGASDELSSLATAEPAMVQAHWQMSMGITYPGDVEITAGTSAAPVSTAALRPAADRFRTALDAAARHAAASLAVRRLDAELVATRRRRRAIEDRLLPTLTASIRDIALHLDELDREEATRVRIAVGRAAAGRGASHATHRARHRAAHRDAGGARHREEDRR